MKIGSFAMIIAFLLFSVVRAIGQYVCEGNCVNGYGLKKVEGSKAYMKGKFLEGTLQEGIVVFPNGDVFRGKFKNNFLREGSKVLHNGKRLEGKFHENVLIDGKITDADGSSRRIKMKSLGMAN